MKLLTKAMLVTAMGAVVFVTPQRADAAPKDDPCFVIATGACTWDWEAACMQYCGVYNGEEASCKDVDNDGFPEGDTINCTGWVE